MSRLLLPSFATSMWHWRQNCAVGVARVLGTVSNFGSYGPLSAIDSAPAIAADGVRALFRDIFVPPSGYDVTASAHPYGRSAGGRF